jgi:hypothetical protein
VHEHLAGRVEDADVHGLHVEVDSARVAMLTVVESQAGTPTVSCDHVAAACGSIGSVGRTTRNDTP